MELAKAYVQIIPSADGITDSITNVIAPGAQSAGQTAGHHTARAGLSDAVAEVFHHLRAVEAVVDGLTDAAVLQRAFGILHAKAKIFSV